MTYDPTKHHRRSICLKGFDYSRPSAYFVTVCTRHRKCLFGEVLSGRTHLNPVGEMVQETWNELPQNYPGVRVDAFVVMPNHVHGIILLLKPPRAPGQPQGVAPTVSLVEVVHRFKSLTTTRYRRGVANNTWPPLTGTLWQRNYYERIIRNATEMGAISRYIHENPLRWEFDRENPECTAPDDNDPWS